MPTTLRDVALRAGVSIKTVSNVVRGHPNVKAEIRRRVQAILEELHYKPNISARHLRTGQIGVISLVLPDLHNPYLIKLADEIIRRAEEQNYAILIDYSHGRWEKEKSILDGLRPHPIDGMLLYPIGLTRQDLEQRQSQFPVILLSNHTAHTLYDHISINYTTTAMLATQHLIEQGRKHIALVSSHASQSHHHSKQSFIYGYMKSLQEHNLSVQSKYIFETTGNTYMDGYHAAKKLLSLTQHPDALCCYNDFIALGAMRAIQEQGLNIPEDIAVIGADNSMQGLFATPSLSTIAQDIQQTADVVVSLLLARIKRIYKEPPGQHEVPLQLVARESTLGKYADTSFLL